MKWTFEQKMAWIKAYKNGGTVPKPEDFRNSQKRRRDKIRNWIHVLEEFGEDGLEHLGTRAFTAGDPPVDVEEGELPRQLHHGIVFGDDEERDVLRPPGRIRELRDVREGGRRARRLVQRDEDQIPEIHEKMDDPFGLLRGKLRWTSVRSVVMMVPIQSSKLGTHQRKLRFQKQGSFCGRKGDLRQ